MKKVIVYKCFNFTYHFTYEIKCEIFAREVVRVLSKHVVYGKHNIQNENRCS